MLVRARPHLENEELLQVLSSNVSVVDIEKFEIEFAEKIGLSRCYATHQGRDALALALKIIGTKPGDEIIVPNFICSVVIDSILSVGATPVLVDNSLTTFNVAVEDYERAITPKTKALLALHLYGIPSNADQLKQLAIQKNCYLLEDCAHTLNSKIRGKNVGTFGDLSFFSFNFDKPMSLGQGGMLAVNNAMLNEAAEKIVGNTRRETLEEEKSILKSLLLQHFLTAEARYVRYLPIVFAMDAMRYFPGVSSRIDDFIRSGDFRILGRIARQTGLLRVIRKMMKNVKSISRHPEPALPLLMNALRAKFGTYQIKHLDAVEERRRANSLAYQKVFQATRDFQLPLLSDSFFASFSRFTVLTRDNEQRKQLIEKAKHCGVELDHGNWERTIASTTGYLNKVRKVNNVLETSEELAARILHLPTHYYVSAEHVDKINQIFE